LVFLGLLLGCPSDPPATADTTSTGNTTEAECPLGAVGCECTAGGGCDPGLECVVGVCVPDDDTSTDPTIVPDTSATTLDTSETASSSSASASSTDVSSSSDGSSGDESSTTGEPSPCGNGRLEDGEICDDGNTADGDGCNADCQPGGQEMWTTIIDGGFSRDDYPSRIAIDANDDIYVAASGYTNVVNDIDGVLVKLDDDGQELWVERYDSDIGGSNDGYWGVAITADQGVAVSGYQNAESGFIVPIVHKYSADGEVLWAHIEPNAGDGQGLDIDVDSDGNVVATGRAHNMADSDVRTWLVKMTNDGEMVWNQRLDVPTGGDSMLVEITDDDDIILARADGLAYVQGRDPDGDELWTWTDMLEPGTIWTGIAVDGDDVWICGWLQFDGTTYFGRFPQDGNAATWTDGWLGSYGAGALAYDVAVDGAGRTVWVGIESGFIGEQAIFVRKLEPDGEHIWSHSEEALPGIYNIATGVAIDSLDQVVVVARYRDEDPDIDIWIRKLTQ
jgi:cysteine-rich repeat protein